MDSMTIAFLIYGGLVLLIGLWAARSSMKTASEIHLGNRQHGTWTSALSSSASTESGFVLLGMVGMGYSVGMNAFWIIPAGILGYLLNWLFLGPRLRAKSAKLEAVTVPEFVFKASGSSSMSKICSILVSLIAITFLIAYTSAQLTAAGKALSTQFSLEHLSGVLIGSGLVIGYAMLGGFKAVAWTDNIQAIMMAFALIALPILIVVEAGGLTHIHNQLTTIDPALGSLTGGSTGLSSLMAVLPWLMLGLAYPGQPHALARLMATKNQQVFKPAAIISIVWFCLVYGGAVILGMAARIAFSDTGNISTDPETILPTLAQVFLPGVIAGITTAAILAAISSTADSTLLSSATTLVHDIRQAFKLPTLKHEARWFRVAILVLGIISVLFAIQQTGLVFQLVLYAWTGLGITLGPVMLYSAVAARPSPIAIFMGLLTGIIALVLLSSHALNLLLGFLAATLSITVVHWVLSLSQKENIGR